MCKGISILKARLLQEVFDRYQLERRVLDALDASPRRDNTVVVLWSDPGFHLGEKEHQSKFALWEKSTHIPFIVVVPGIVAPGTICERPVDMSTLYPTLLELCGLPADESCDGRSIVPLLRDPHTEWQRPALMTYMRGNHAVRSDRWRYIRYADGTEELYDHTTDLHEWTNLAGDSLFTKIKEEHRKWLPDSEAKQAPNLKKPTTRSPKLDGRVSMDTTGRLHKTTFARWKRSL
jgi:arylsulfatase A-like enzyme